MKKLVCFRCGASGDSEWSAYTDSLSRVKGEDIALSILEGFSENEVVFCELCKIKFFKWLTGIEFYAPSREESQELVGIDYNIPSG